MEKILSMDIKKINIVLLLFKIGYKKTKMYWLYK